MSPFEALFLICALGMIVLSILTKNVRGVAWTALIAIDVVISDAYINAGHPLPDVFMAICDFSVCAVIYWLAATKFERLIFLTMQFSMLVSILHLGAEIRAPGWVDMETYLTVLELANYVVLIIVGTWSGLIYGGRTYIFAFAPWRRVLPFGSLARRLGAKVE